MTSGLQEVFLEVPGRLIAGLLYQGSMQREVGKLGTQTIQALKSGKPGFKH